MKRREKAKRVEILTEMHVPTLLVIAKSKTHIQVGRTKGGPNKSEEEDKSQGQTNKLAAFTFDRHKV